jgi:hypothetical protein
MSENTKTVTIQQVMVSAEPLKELANQDIQIGVAVSLTKTIREVDEVMKIFDENKNKLFKEYGEELDEEQGIKIKEENIEVFNEKYVELLNQEVEIDAKDIDVSDLGDIDMKATSLLALEWLINI